MTTMQEMNGEEVRALLREKPDATPEDIERVQKGEPLAYVLGTQPFLGLSLSLRSRPLIPRPETEWWTELLCAHIGERPLRVLDLCAGSGAVGLAVLKHCPRVRVSFGELVPDHADIIRENIERNALSAERADIRTGDMFVPFPGERYDIVAANPPYIPEGRVLEESLSYEPKEALFSGSDGLDAIRRIATDAPQHLTPGGEVWIEGDSESMDAAARLVKEGGAHTVEVRTDQYQRPRLLVGYY